MIINNKSNKSGKDNLLICLFLYRKVDHFTICCHVKQSNPRAICISQADDGLSSCDELLKNSVLKYSMWILGIVAFSGNLMVIAWRIFVKDINPVNSFLLTHLAVADFLMGVYMLIIAFKDKLWDGVYFKHDVNWRASDLCKFAGVISTISSEVSVLTLSVITLDRFICIVFPFRFQRWSLKRASVIMCVVWILGMAISLTPLIYDTYFYDYSHNVNFFGRSAVCLPMQLSRDRSSGWEYSVFIFLILNGLSFLLILLAYVIMYKTVARSAKAVRISLNPVFNLHINNIRKLIHSNENCFFKSALASKLTLFMESVSYQDNSLATSVKERQT